MGSGIFANSTSSTSNTDGPAGPRRLGRPEVARSAGIHSRRFSPFPIRRNPSDSPSMRSSIKNDQGSPSGIELAITSPSGVQPVKLMVTLSWAPGCVVPLGFRQDLPGQSARGLGRLGRRLRDVGGRRRRDRTRAPQRLDRLRHGAWTDHRAARMVVTTTTRRGRNNIPATYHVVVCGRVEMT